MMTFNARPNYISEYGWTIQLPSGWNVLPVSTTNALNRNKPVVFSSGEDWSISFTWMRNDQPVETHLLNDYFIATMLTGAIEPAQAQALVDKMFPIMGTILEARVVPLTDGNRALEIIDEVLTGQFGAGKKGYHLVLPMPGRSHHEQVYMQRLLFYCDAARFNRLIPHIMASARSFYYLS